MWGGRAARSARNASKSYSTPSHSSTSSEKMTEKDYTGLEDSYRIADKVKDRFRERGAYLKYCDFYYKYGMMEGYITVLIKPDQTNKRADDFLRIIKDILRNDPIAQKYEISIRLETGKW